MAKISKSEFLDNIQNIINEGMNADVRVDNTKKFGIRRHVISLLESGQRNPRLMTYLNKYNTLLNNSDVKEFMVYEQFGQGLAQYATGNKEVKNVIASMNETLANYGNELQAYMLIEQVQDPMAQEAIRTAYDNYLDEEDEASRSILIDAVDMIDAEGDPVAPQLLIVIADDAQSRLPQIELGTSESKFDLIQQKIKEEKDRKRMEEIKDKVDAYAREVFANAEAEKQAEIDACCFDNIVNNNGLCLRESIKNICSSDARSNKRLMETLEQYAGALNQGLYEERLYEGFLQNISKFNYLLPVEKEIKRINEVAQEHASSIIVTKILEEMQASTSYYIVPLIEEDACRYVKDPNAINRGQLRQALCSFAADPYCHAMLEAIERDNTMIGNTLAEKALNIKDQIKVIRENANISAIYSPVQYIKENECIFNANGQFFVKKGNTLAKLSNEYLDQLSESFVALCQLVNDPRVTINEDSIVLVGTDKIANIYEGYVDINGCRETTDTLRNLNEMTMKYDFDTNFFIMASCLHENFNNIAKVDFGKHIALNENEGINVDMFRLGNNIFINTVNEAVDKSTFYHNVNPLQCRNIINKHMGINVASLFEDLIPSQEKIIMKLNETKNSYEKLIEDLEATIKKLQDAKENCVSDENEKKLDDAIKTAEKKLADLKSEYKGWQEKVEKQTTAKGDDEEDAEVEDKSEKSDDLEDDPNTEVEDANEPIDADDVEAAKDELSQPVNAEEDPTVSDDEFDSYLEGGDEVPANAEEMPMDEEPAEDDDMFDEPAEDEVEMDEPMDDAEVEEPAEDPFKEVDVDDEPMEEPAEGDMESEPIEEPVEGEPMESEPVEDEDEDTMETSDTLNGETSEEVVAVPEGYKITNISFDKNIKTDEVFNTGTVSVICPMVDGNGRLYVQSNDYQFYVDQETKLPVLDAAGVPVALYNAIVSSIKAEPEYTNVCDNGVAEDKVDVKLPDEKTDIFYDAEDVKNASDELEAGDESDFFDYTDDDDQLTITPKVADDEAPVSIKDIFDEPAAEVEEPAEVVIPTYKSEDGETEIELPAPAVDGTEIPEAKPEEADELAVVADDESNEDELPVISDEESEEDELPVEECNKAVNESRKSILNISSEFKKNGKSFFLNEGTIKPSKKEESRINEATANIDSIDVQDEAPMYEPYENYDEHLDLNTLEVMHTKAENALGAASEAGHNLKVTPIENLVGISYFTIEDLTSEADIDSYTCYQIGNEIFYRPSEDFYMILRDLEDEVPGQSEEALRYDYDEDKLKDYIDINDVDACVDLVNIICMSFGIHISEAYPMDESVKVRRPKLSSEGDRDKSKMTDDILHGDKEKRDFEEQVEKETQKAGVDNPLAPLAPPQEESTKAQVLPNMHNVSESQSINEKKDEELEIIYEPEDWIIIKETGKRAQIHSVQNDGDGKLVLLTAIGPDGVYTIEDLNLIEPDPMYLENIPGRAVNSQNLMVSEIPGVDINPETRMPNPLPDKAPKEDDEKDDNPLYKLTVPVCVMVEGCKLNTVPYGAIVEDIKDSKKMIRVINEDGEIHEYDAEQNLEFEDMPYAVVVDSEGKPVRSIKIDPLSYINAEEDELVDCACGDKATKFPKKVISIIS